MVGRRILKRVRCTGVLVLRVTDMSTLERSHAHKNRKVQPIKLDGPVFDWTPSSPIAFALRAFKGLSVRMCAGDAPL